MAGRKAGLSEARNVALALVTSRRRRDAHMRDLLRGSAAFGKLSAQDRALAARLALGATAARGMLDSLISSHLSRGHLEPRVRDALEIAAYELLYMKTPSAVVVSQGVELVRSVNPRAAGLANAILHRIADEDVPQMEKARTLLETEPEKADAATLALVGGLPSWLADEILSSIGPAKAASLALAQADPAPIYVAPNRALVDGEELHRRLSEAGLAPKETALPGTFELGAPQGLSTSGLVQDVVAVPSDLAAQAVAAIVAPSPGERFLEIGQGRATKTLLLLGARKGLEEGDVAEPPLMAVESEPFKAKIARERLSHGWAGASKTFVLDGRCLKDGTALPEELQEPFDAVFLDAPCSGTGTLRRHPEIVWSLAEESLDVANPEGLPALQLALLEAAASRVCEGGRLIYATCSVLAQEDEDIVERFLASEGGRGFEVADAISMPAAAAMKDVLAPHIMDAGFFRTAPSPQGPDGHFCCVLVRKA